MILGPIELRLSQNLTVDVHTDGRSLIAKPPSVETMIIRLLKRSKMETRTKWKISTVIKDHNLDVSSLADPVLMLTNSHVTGLLETITGAGSFEINLVNGESRIVLVNPNQARGFKCRSKTLLEVNTRGTVLPETLRPVEIDYFGLIQKTL